MKTFLGFKRPDGRIGVRNMVLILPTNICASDTAELIASKVPGSVSFHNQVGCSQVPSDMQYALDVMAGFAANPNVYGTILIGLGCETCQADIVESEIKKRTCKPLKTFVIQHMGGLVKTVEAAVKAAESMVKDSSLCIREEFPVSQLLVGTECGGSDPTSGIAANPTIGALSDMLINEGSTVILSETTEFIGAEDILAARGADEEVKSRIYNIISRYEKHFIRNGENVRFGNPTPGNKEGGLTTLEEKSLGCIHKGGSSTINAVYDYGKQIPCDMKGLIIMDTPGNDASSIAGMLAGGAQLIVFSTGRGTPLGSPIAPVIKITGNRFTAETMSDVLDFDASLALNGEKSVIDLSEDLYKFVLEVCNGRQTKSEILGFTETAVMRACNYV